MVNLRSWELANSFPKLNFLSMYVPPSIQLCFIYAAVKNFWNWSSEHFWKTVVCKDQTLLSALFRRIWRRIKTSKCNKVNACFEMWSTCPFRRELFIFKQHHFLIKKTVACLIESLLSQTVKRSKPCCIAPPNTEVPFVQSSPLSKVEIPLQIWGCVCNMCERPWQWGAIEIAHLWVLIKGLMVHVVAMVTFVWLYQYKDLHFSTHICSLSPSLSLSHAVIRERILLASVIWKEAADT